MGKSVMVDSGIRKNRPLKITLLFFLIPLKGQEMTTKIIENVDKHNNS